MSLKRTTSTGRIVCSDPEERAKRFRNEGTSVKSRLGGFAGDQKTPSKKSSTLERLGPQPRRKSPSPLLTRPQKTAVTWTEDAIKTEPQSMKTNVDLRTERGLSSKKSLNGEHSSNRDSSLKLRLSSNRIDLKTKNSLTDIDSTDSSLTAISTGKLETVIHSIDVNTRLTTGLIDTHMHIDFTLNTHDSHESSWKDFCKRFSARFPSCYEGAIAAFSQPNSFTCSSTLLNEAFQDERIWMTFGVHPHFSDQYSEDALRACLHKFKSKIVALGEVGLDTSKKNHVSLEVQKEVFRSQAEIGIENGLPLVIHTRVHNNNEETLLFMRKFVPRDHKIHRHCFTGYDWSARVGCGGVGGSSRLWWRFVFHCRQNTCDNIRQYFHETPKPSFPFHRTWDEANDWISHFRNCYLGFTALINTQPDLMKVAARVPFDRILLETDSPYFKNGVPRVHDGTRPLGTMPGDVIYTAAGIAKARGIPLEAVICQCRLNAKNVFGI